MSRLTPSDYSFTRYLAAKKSVDDRALNEQVWQALKETLPKTPLQVLEIGAGIGTMVERTIDRQLFTSDVTYTAIDTLAANIEEAHRLQPVLPEFFNLRLEAIDLFDFAAREQGKHPWDLLITHAFLDLVDLTQTLPILLSLLKPGSLFYFTLNFDGARSSNR
jgi:2-polyprenyl-3-methyl-5-hydroxy-6-metoxy-1,4-benzoquinol methylase